MHHVYPSLTDTTKRGHVALQINAWRNVARQHRKEARAAQDMDGFRRSDNFACLYQNFLNGYRFALKDLAGKE